MWLTRSWINNINAASRSPLDFVASKKTREALTSAMARAAATPKPLVAMCQVFRSLEQLLEEYRLFSLPRQRVIDRTPALQERELAKIAALTETLALALRQRGVDEWLAALAARAGMTIFCYAARERFMATQAGVP